MGEQKTVLVLLFILVSLVAAVPASGASDEDSWVSKAPMHVARGGLGVAVVNGKIYAIGGYTENGVVTRVNEVYDPETDTWTYKTSMPTPRGNFATAVYQNKIYCIGGTNEGTNEVYNPATDMWVSKASVPTPVSYIKANVVNGKFYLIEINPRFPAWCYLCPGAGQNLPWACVQLAMGKMVEPFTTYKVGAMFLRHSMDMVYPLSMLEALTIEGELHSSKTVSA